MKLGGRRLLATLLSLASTLAWPAAAHGRPPDPLPPLGGWWIPSPPKVESPSWILYDIDSGRVIASLDPDARRAPASTTKIMTALVALENAPLDDAVRVSNRAVGVGESEIGLFAGESFPLGILVEAMLVRSANDAAVAVAEHVGGSIAGFTELMNAKAIELGLVNTNFENPHGLDGRRHYSSARDLLTMTLAASQQAGFTEMVSSVKIAFPTAPDGTVRDAPTTNHLISEYIGATGVKTGYTDRAGLVLVASASRWGRDLIAVVMGAQSAGGHFRDATSLLDFGFNATARMTVLSGNPYPASADGSAPPLSVEATVETLILLNSADFDAVTVAGPSVEPVEVIRSGPDPLPGLRDVLDWTARYWMWLNGAFT